LKIFGPILAGELKAVVRRKRTFIIRMVYIGLCFLVVYSTAKNLTKSPSFMRSSIGIIIFTYFALTQIIMLLMLTPALASGSIAKEKEEGTLGLLFLTRVSPREIVWGKFSSRLLYVALLVAASLPLLSISFVFGGVSLIQLAIVFLLTGATVILAGAISVYFSTLLERAHTATIATYGVLFFYFFLLPVVLLPLLFLPMVLGLHEIFNYINPLFAMSAAFSWGMGAGADWTMWLGISWNIAFPILLSVLLLRAASRRLHRISFLEKESSKRWGRLRKALKPRRPRRLFSFRKSKAYPLLWRETYIRPASRFRVLVLVAFGLVALCEISYSILILAYQGQAVLDPAEIVGTIYLVVFCLLTFVFTALSASLAFVTERERNSWEPLLVTPVSRRSLVWAKFLGTAQDAAPFLLVTFFHLGLMYLAQILSGWEFVGILSVIMATFAFVVALGLVISLGSKRSVRALAAGVMSFLGLAFLLPWLSGFFEQEGLSKVLWGASPLYWLTALGRLDEPGYTWIPWWGVYLFLISYAVAALSLFLFAILRFDRLATKT